MAGLACRDVSAAAWKILDWLVSDYVAVPDTCATVGMRALADGSGDVPIVSGESAAGGMGVLLAAADSPRIRADLGLDERSCVILFGGEGATDLDIYRELIGEDADAVFARQATYLEANRA
jgi:diaminopropionate ammonia-lyase